jgi:hypothetical protein
MDEDLKQMTPEQLQEAKFRAEERTKEVRKRITDLMEGHRTGVLTREQFEAHMAEYQKEREAATAEEKRIWRFINR